MHWILIAHLIAYSGAVPSTVTQEFDDIDSCRQALDALANSYTTPYRIPQGFCTPKGRPADVCVTTYPPLPAFPTGDAPQPAQKCAPGDLPKPVFSDVRR